MNMPDAQKENAQPMALPQKTPHEETDEELVNRFRKQIDADDNYLRMLLTAGTGHATLLHVGTDYPNIMERILTEASPRKPKFSNSTFQTDEDCLKYVRFTLRRKAPRIIKWIRHETEKPTYTVTYNTKNTITGYGFEFESAEFNEKFQDPTERRKPSIYEYESYTCHVDLKRPGKKEQLSDDILENIRISTAYPQMGPQHGIKLRKDLRPIVARTKTYKNSTPIEQVWFDYISNDPTHAVYPAIHDDTRLQIYVPDPPRENTILIGTTPAECVLRAVDPDPAKPTPLTQAILATGKFPNGTVEFPFTGTVRDVLTQRHGTELGLADHLYGEIQKKLGGGRNGTALIPVVPEPGPDGPSEKYPSLADVQTGSATASPPAKPAETARAGSQIELMLRLNSLDRSRSKPNTHNGTQLGG